MINNPILMSSVIYAWKKYDTETPYKSIDSVGGYVYVEPSDIDNSIKYKDYAFDSRTGTFILTGREYSSNNSGYYPSTTDKKIYAYSHLYQSGGDPLGRDAWREIKSVKENPVKGDICHGIVFSNTANSYPNDGEQGGYWYIFVGEVGAESTSINTGDGLVYIWEKSKAVSVYKTSSSLNGQKNVDDKVGNAYAEYTLDSETGVFSLTGEPTGYPRYYATTSPNKIYEYEPITIQGSTNYWYTPIESIKDLPIKGDTCYGTVTSEDQATYPANGEQDGYWYVLVGESVGGGSTGSGINTSDATATAEEILKDKTAYVKGEKVTGILKYYPSIISDESNATALGYIYNADEVEFVEGQNNRIRLTKNIGTTEEVAFLDGSEISVQYLASNFGNATAADVANGKTFTSINGLKITGTATASAPTLQSKTVSPSTSQQIITPDSGYDGLSQVTVNAMPTTALSTPTIAVDNAGKITATVQQASAGYVAAGSKSATKQLTTRGAATITPGTSDLAIASGVYLSGNQTIKGDANLIAGNIKKGVSIFGVVGSFDGSGGGGSSSDNNCEAYHITSASATLNFKTTGTVKVWGYGYQQGGYMGTHYSFVGDGYYSGGYGTPRKTTASFSINADGTLSGLPNDLTSVDLLVTIGV